MAFQPSGSLGGGGPEGGANSAMGVGGVWIWSSLEGCCMSETRYWYSLLFSVAVLDTDVPTEVRMYQPREYVYICMCV